MIPQILTMIPKWVCLKNLRIQMGLSENVGFIFPMIASHFSWRDNDQQNHWVQWGTQHFQTHQGKRVRQNVSKCGDSLENLWRKHVILRGDLIYLMKYDWGYTGNLTNKIWGVHEQRIHGDLRSDVSYISSWQSLKNHGHNPQESKHNGYMGVSENSVPLNPMVNDHYPY